MHKNTFVGLRVFVFLLLMGGFAWAETVELVTYYPAGAAAGGDQHVQSLTVGNAYQATPTPPLADGAAFIVGPVGIGTTNPRGPLHVMGANDVVSNVNFSAGVNTAVPGTPQIRVGIGHETGTSVPLYALDVVGFNGANQSIYSRALDGSMARLGLENTIRHWSISNYGTQFAPNGAFAIADEAPGAGVRLLITQPAGFVGIGTAAPTQRLDVAGNIRMSGTRSVLLTQGDNGTTHVGGVQFLTPNNGIRMVMTPTDASGATVNNSIVTLGGLGNFNSNTVGLGVSGNLGVGQVYNPPSAAPNGQANGNIDVNDVFVRSANNNAGQWLSQMRRLPGVRAVAVYRGVTFQCVGSHTWASGNITHHLPTAVVGGTTPFIVAGANQTGTYGHWSFWGQRVGNNANFFRVFADPATKDAIITADFYVVFVATGQSDYDGPG